jgi:hypothetical protein
MRLGESRREQERRLCQDHAKIRGVEWRGGPAFHDLPVA